MIQTTLTMQPPSSVCTPHPALNQLDKLVGTWRVWDPSGADAVRGQVSCEWMEGGFYLMQYVDLDISKGVEIIGYDEECQMLKSHFFSHTGERREYVYEIEDDTLIISIESPNICGDFVGTFSADGSAYTGSWEWTQGGVEMGYDMTMAHVRPAWSNHYDF